MQPVKAKIVIGEYAEKIGVPAEHVELMAIAAFQTLKDMMATYDHNMISVPGLGTFFFRVWKIEDEVKKCNNILRAATLPVSVLDAIQEKRESLIKMDAIILAEMDRRADKREDQRKNGIHNHTRYKNGECRCPICAADHKKVINRYRDRVIGKKEREQYRQSLLKRYNESKGQTPESMGE